MVTGRYQETFEYDTITDLSLPYPSQHNNLTKLYCNKRLTIDDAASKAQFENQYRRFQETHRYAKALKAKKRGNLKAGEELLNLKPRAIMRCLTVTAYFPNIFAQLET